MYDIIYIVFIDNIIIIVYDVFMIIKIDGYLTEDKLYNVLCQLFGVHNIKREARVPNSRRRWDFLIFNKIIVEFDGDQHFWNSNIIRSDIEKDECAYSMNRTTIRIPYFVQLTTETLNYYFGITNTKIIQNFPHGFIKTKIYPASFSELGMNKFKNIFINLPSFVQQNIIVSLNEKIKIHNIQYVIPEYLRDILK